MQNLTVNEEIYFNNEVPTMNTKMLPFDLPFNREQEKYRGAAIRWLETPDHYELIFTDDFVTPSSNSLKFSTPRSGPFSLGGNALITDIILDMRNGNKEKEVHVFVGSFGGEVAALSMIFQQLLCYKHRVGINLGTACSCGWMLLFACPERYVSPFSQTMYHDISNMAFGKHSELRSNAEFMSLWQKELLHATDTQKVLTEKELELGRTSEVWLTGRQLIERKAAKDYNEYLTRRTPKDEIYNLDGTLLKYSPFEAGWVAYKKVDKSKVLSYSEILEMINTPPTLQMAKVEKAKKGEKQVKQTKE